MFYVFRRHFYINSICVISRFLLSFGRCGRLYSQYWWEAARKRSPVSAIRTPTGSGVFTSVSSCIMKRLLLLGEMEPPLGGVTVSPEECTLNVRTASFVLCFSSNGATSK